jgi:hypothetical protein
MLRGGHCAASLSNRIIGQCIPQCKAHPSQADSFARWPNIRTVGNAARIVGRRATQVQQTMRAQRICELMKIDRLYQMPR